MPGPSEAPLAAEIPADAALGSYGYDYPARLVAGSPARPRDSARLLVLDRASGRTSHRRFSDLPGLLAPGDCVVVNSTRVRRARLLGSKPTGGKAELLLLRPLGPASNGVTRWAALARGVKPGDRVLLPGGASAAVEARLGAGEWACALEAADPEAYLEAHGLPPLPPYVLKRRRAEGLSPAAAADAADYQTVYAGEPGSVAAPTAGLHFTGAVIEGLRSSGVEVLSLVLHVGHGTFQPVEEQDVRLHRMKPEWYSLPAAAAGRILACRRSGRRVVAVGTTVMRSLESWAAAGRLEGWTDLFIAPGHEFKAADAFLTNFHLPRSTPLILAAAFAGRGRLLAAYREAVEEGYRLFSFGDAMLIL